MAEGFEPLQFILEALLRLFAVSFCKENAELRLGLGQIVLQAQRFHVA
jgi:hypothetical protein